MSKKPTITTVSSGYASNTQLNNNFTALRNAFDNTLSLDGSSPNAMGADFDMNGHDIIDAGTVFTSILKINGETVVPSAVAALSYVDGSGTPVGDVVPDFMGQEYFDTSAEDWYKATGLTSSDWKQITA